MSTTITIDPPSQLAARDGAPYRQAEVAALLGVKPATLADWRKRGHGPPFLRLGEKHSQIRYPRAPFWTWVDSRTVRSDDEADGLELA